MIEWLNEHWQPVIWALVALAALYVLLSPRLFVKFVGRLLRLVFLRVRIHGKANIPYSGPVLLVSNHISLLDLIMIQAVSRRRVRFMVHTSLVSFLPITWLFRYLGVIEVPNMRRPKAMLKFFENTQVKSSASSPKVRFPATAV